MKASATFDHANAAKAHAGRGQKRTQGGKRNADRLGSRGQVRLSHELRFSLSSRDVEAARSAMASGELGRAHVLIRRILAAMASRRLTQCVRALIDDYIQAENAALVSGKRLREQGRERGSSPRRHSAAA